MDNSPVYILPVMYNIFNLFSTDEGFNFKKRRVDKQSPSTSSSVVPASAKYSLAQKDSSYSYASSGQPVWVNNVTFLAVPLVPRNFVLFFQDICRLVCF